MDKLITSYQQRLNLQNAAFSLIDHDDAMVAIVYRVTKSSGKQLILKICTRAEDFRREVYFLNFFADKLQVPRILQVIQPEEGFKGAILMECLPGGLLKITDYTQPLAYEIGSQLARIHLNRVSGYGDLTQPDHLSNDPRVYFTLKFEEGFAECRNHLPQALLEECRHYYDDHLYLLTSVDGPCMIHRDFRPGNLIVNGGKLHGIIDWAGGRGGFAEEDFCPMEHREWPTDSMSRDSFLAGYASIRPVPNYTAMMSFLRMNRAFAAVGFTVKQGTWDSSHVRVYQYNRRFLDTFLGYSEMTSKIGF